MMPSRTEQLKAVLYRATLLLDRVLKSFPSLGPFRPLKGSFSAWERLKSGDLQGATIVESQDPGPFGAGSLDERVGMRQYDHQPWPVFWVRSDEARLVGKMLHWRDSCDLICLEGVYGLERRRRLGEDAFFAQILLPKAKFLPGAWISLASNWADGRNYYHWVTDALTRLQIREYLPEETRILLPATSQPYIGETLAMLGLDSIAEHPTAGCIHPERFYFCSASAMTGVWNPMGFDWLRERFSAFRNPSASGRPVFLTRRGATRIPEDISEIESEFIRSGFDIVDCGSLSVRQQVSILSSAPAIAGFHGAAMTNLLWAHPGTPVFEILSPDHLNACYEQIANQGRLPYSYHVRGSGSLMDELRAWLAKLDT